MSTIDSADIALYMVATPGRAVHLARRVSDASRCIPASWSRRLALLAFASLAAGCAGGPGPEGPRPEPAEDRLPPIPAETGPLALDLVYPPEDATVRTDSTFVFGSVGSGRASAAINGTPVPVAPNGSFLAFLPVPGDGVYRLEATEDGRTARLEREVSVPGITPPSREPPPERREPVATGEPEVEITDLQPTGRLLLRVDEPLTIRLRGTPGGEAWVHLPDGRRVRLEEVVRRDERGGGFMAAGRAVESVAYEVDVLLRAPIRLPVEPDAEEEARRMDALEEAAGVPLDEGVVSPVRADGIPTTGWLTERPAPGEAWVELIARGDTVRRTLGAEVELLQPWEVRAGVIDTQRADSTAIGRAAIPPGTPYHWFFPNGTRVAVVGGRDGQYRVRLDEALEIWVSQSDVRLLGSASGAAGAATTIDVERSDENVDVTVSLTAPLPFRVDPRDGGLTITVYGASSRTNWVYQGEEGPFVRRVHWAQPATDRYLIHVETAAPVWGWKAWHTQNGDLVVRVRRPPPIDPDQPLRGLLIALDAGHGDETGAIGPTRLREGLANRWVVESLAPMLRERGATVMETRPGSEDASLGRRPLDAIAADADLLISVHNNAFPDGVNPFGNNGTSVLYNTWQSLDLARALQRELRAEFGLRDLGVMWGDLALARPSWMPAVLTETMFLMIPEQEAALRDPTVHQRMARAHVRGIEAFLRQFVAR